MISTAAARTNNGLSLYHTAALILVGDICFYLAYTFKPCSFLVLVYLVDKKLGFLFHLIIKSRMQACAELRYARAHSNRVS